MSANVPLNATAIYNVECRWRDVGKGVSSWSPDVAVMLRPSSAKNSRPVRLMGPNDSWAIGIHEVVYVMEALGISLFFARWPIRPFSPGVVDVRWMYDAAQVWTLVTSQ